MDNFSFSHCSCPFYFLLIQFYGTFLSLIKDYHIMFTIIIIIIILLFGIAIGRRDFFCARFTTFHTQASLLTFCFFVWFHSCSRERLWENTLAWVRHFILQYWMVLSLILTAQLQVHERRSIRNRPVGWYSVTFYTIIIILFSYRHNTPPLFELSHCPCKWGSIEKNIKNYILNCKFLQIKLLHIFFCFNVNSKSRLVTGLFPSMPL